MSFFERAPTFPVGHRGSPAARVWLRGGALCVLSLLLCGTTSACSASTLRVWIEVDVARGANGDWPIPVAIVAARDPKLLERLLAMTAKQWFAEREQIRRDFPGGEAFREWEWEYVPGQVVPPQMVEINGEALGAVLFANYRSPGDHRVRLPARTSVEIVLGKEDPAIVPAKRPPVSGDRRAREPGFIVAWAETAGQWSEAPARAGQPLTAGAEQ